MAYRFEGKKALVTGGSRGIGKAIAERLLLEGANVYVIGRSQENLEKLKTENPSINTIQVDVTNWDETKTAVEQIGVVDLLVNNAGIFDQTNFVDVEIDKFDKMIETNCKSAFNITQIIARGLISAARPGVVANMSSVGGFKGVAGFMPYCVSKAILDMLTKVTALELGPHKIRVNSVNPTILKTDMTKDLYQDEEFMQMLRAKHPLGKFATVEDVVNATMFLLSDDSAMITGSSLPVDGGYLIN
ncbi:hypothetical protein KUTeg_022259 [Tegillarca granosa]|uniref:L-xylulose reductase n=1 Tax=Tegillarca granosa TaxID=220873 RepID=A0ABQ9E6H5_TEGGR|nr:hypothetical protein KUTeg_022259 [Tegillarca granosa]